MSLHDVHTKDERKRLVDDFKDGKIDFLFVYNMLLKGEVDKQIEQNSKMLENENFVEKMMMRLVIDQFKNKQNIPLTASATKRINHLLVKEYMNEYRGFAA